MSVKLGLTSKQILDKTFQGATPGYNPLQVDQYLDRIIRDYTIVEANYLLEAKEVDSLHERNDYLEEENKKLVVDNEKLKARLSNIKSTDNVTKDNVDLLRRINSLEKFLYEKGFDPTKIK